MSTSKMMLLFLILASASWALAQSTSTPSGTGSPSGTGQSSTPGSPATPPGSTADTSRQYGYSAGGHDDSAGYAAESNYAWIHESEWSSELYVANDDSPTGRGAGQYDSAFHNQPKFNESERNAGWLPLYASRYDSGHDAEDWVFELIS